MAGYCPMVARASRPDVRSRKRNDQLLMPFCVTRNTRPTHRVSVISSRPDVGGFTERAKASVSCRCTGDPQNNAPSEFFGGTPGAQSHWEAAERIGTQRNDGPHKLPISGAQRRSEAFHLVFTR